MKQKNIAVGIDKGSDQINEKKNIDENANIQTNRTKKQSGNFHIHTHL